MTVASAVMTLGVLAVPASGLVLDPDPTPAPGSRAAITPVARPTCGSEPSDAAGWQRLFDRQSGAWAGGDGASSVRLPDGRLLWLFGDTVVGDVRPDGSRAPGSRIVRNSLLVTDGTCVRSVRPYDDAFPGRDGTWLWPTHAVVSRAGSAGRDSVLTVLAQRVERTGPGAWDFRRTGAASITVTVPWRGTPVIGAVRSLPASSVLWGAALAADGGTTWVYGTREVHEPLVFGRELLLARAPTATLGDPRTWRYRTASGWSSRASEAVVVRTARAGVSTVPSARVDGGRVVLVTKPQEFLDDRVVELRSDHPWGPWRELVLFRSPSTDTVPRYSPALVAGSGSRHAVVVVSRTTTSLARLMADSTLARPTFVDVDLAS